MRGKTKDWETKEKKDKEIVKLYTDEKLGLVEVGRRVGMSPAGVAFRLARLGVSRRPPAGGLASGRYKWAKENNLVSVTSLYERSGGRNPTTVKATVEHLGIEIQERGNGAYLKEADADRVLSELAQPYKLEPRSWKEAGVAEWEMGWLAGIIDGEGCVGIKIRESKKYAGQWWACVQIGNTSRKIIDKIEEILRRLDVDFTESFTHPKNKKWSDSWSVRVGECVSTWRLCREVVPFLVMKKQRTEMLMEFSEKRAENARRGGFLDVVKHYAAKMDTTT